MPSGKISSNLHGKNMYKKPDHHWQGFGRSSSVPEWWDYGRRRIDSTKKPEFMWEASVTGLTRTLKPNTDGTPPYIHDTSDNRIYRPEIIPDKNRIEVMVPAPLSQRGIVESIGTRVVHGKKDKLEAGLDKKVFTYDRESHFSKMQRKANLGVSTECLAKDMIGGRARTIERPLLYPAGHLNHNMVLAMEGKASQTLPYDKRPPPDNTPFKLWDQSMYIPHSRTRSDFPHVKKLGNEKNNMSITPADTNTLTSGYLRHSGYNGPSHNTFSEKHIGAQANSLGPSVLAPIGSGPISKW